VCVTRQVGAVQNRSNRAVNEAAVARVCELRSCRAKARACRRLAHVAWKGHTRAEEYVPQSDSKGAWQHERAACCRSCIERVPWCACARNR